MPEPADTEPGDRLFISLDRGLSSAYGVGDATFCASRRAWTPVLSNNSSARPGRDERRFAYGMER